MAIMQVKTEDGWVEGLPSSNQSVTVFKGVPFAAPPVGELRWRAPQPVRRWEGVSQCYKFAPIAMQPRAVSEGGGATAINEFYVIEHPMSEDCLYLNIWTPAKSPDEKLPVGVYIHGGGHTTGYSYLQAYDGDGFAKRGCIFVTIAYRLNVFGYLAHPELTAESGYNSSSNYGILDQVAAIKWVKRNIAAFGGDPNRITVFGQSGGGSSTQTMCTTPLTKGVFQRAIMQSGGGLRRPYSFWAESLANAEELGVKFLEFLGAKNIAEARAMSSEQIWKAMVEFSNVKIADNETKGPLGYMRFSPVVDGYVLPESQIDICLHNKHHELDYMLTSAADEGVGTTVANLAWCENELALGRKPSYLLYFTYVPPGAEAVGAHHSVEHHYVFQTFMRSKRPYGAFDFDLSNELADLWANFIKTGDPNGPGLPKWTPYTKEAPYALFVDKERVMKPIPETPEMIKMKNNTLGR